MPTQNIGLRIDADLLAQVDALAAEQGTSRTFVIVEALHRMLGLAKSSTVEQRLADVEQRLGIVEQALGSSAKQRLTPSNKPDTPPQTVPTAAAPIPPPKQPRQDAQQGGSSPSQVSEHPTESPQKADGGRWLTTKDAWQRARGRGCTKENKDAFRSWANRNPGDAAKRYGLRRIERPPSKDNSLASFEDLRWGE